MKRLALLGLIVSGCLLPSVELVDSFDEPGGGGAAGMAGSGTQSNGGDHGDAGSSSSSQAGVNGEDGGAPPVIDGPPHIVSVVPADMAGDAEPDAAVVITFNEGLDETTVNASSVQLLDGDSPLDGELLYSGVKITFKPARRLALGSPYSVRVTTDVTDSGGQHLEQDFASDFDTRLGAWTEEAPYLATPGTWGERHAAAVDASGNMLVVWLQSNQSAASLSAYARWYHPGTGWDEPELLETDAAECQDIALAVTPAGDAVVVWSQILAATNRWALLGRRFVAGAWEAQAARLDNPDNGGFASAPEQLHAAASEDHFVAAWVVAAASPNQAQRLVQANGVGLSGAWPSGTMGVDITQDDDTVPDLSLRMTATGKGLMTWCLKASGGVTSIRYSTYAAASNTWANPLTIAGAQPFGHNRIGLALDDDGDGMLIWAKSNPGNAELMASRFTRGTGFASAEAIDALTDVPIFASQQGIASDGHHFVVGWVQTMTGIANAFAAYYDADLGMWEDPELVSDGASYADYDGPRITMDAHGNALAAWAQGQLPTQYAIAYNVLGPNGWGEPATLTTNDVPYTGIELFGGTNGFAAALLDSGARNANDADLVSYFASFE